MSLDSAPLPDLPVSALGFDYGTQKIGVAFGQSLTSTAKPVSILKARDGIPDWQEIDNLLLEWKPDILVVGMPYNLDGSDSELLKRAIKFANRLHGRFGKPCYGIDERLSSVEAKSHLADATGSAKKRAAIDDIAAQIILESWFTKLSKPDKKN